MISQSEIDTIHLHTGKCLVKQHQGTSWQTEWGFEFPGYQSIITRDIHLGSLGYMLVLLAISIIHLLEAYKILANKGFALFEDISIIMHTLTCSSKHK